MTSRIQTNRLTATGARPPSTRPVGELAINFADNQISVTDPTPAARDMLPIRYHSAAATYLTNDIVCQSAGLYQAKANTPAHTFNATEWNQFIPVGNYVAGLALPALGSYGGANVGFQLPAAARLIFSKGAPAAADYATVEVQRSTSTYSVPTGVPSTINAAFRVTGVVGANDGATNWGTILQNSTSSTQAGASCIGGAFQGVRLAGSRAATWGGIINVIDQTNNASSVTGGGVTAGEIDLRASGADDGANGSRFGGVGLRQNFQIQIVRNSTLADLEVATGIWFCNNLAAGDQTHNTYLQGLGCQVGVQMYQLLDARGAVTPASYTDPLAAVRMGAGQCVDFNGGLSLKSNAGNYLQYTTTGNDRLRYMDGATEVFSVTDTGSLTALASFNLPTGAGFSSDATYTTLTMDSGNYRMRYTRANGVLQYLRGSDSVELWSVDSVGNSKIPGTLAVTSTLTVGSKASIGGTGVTYTGVASNNHAHAFGWDGTHTFSWIDGTNQGALATLAELAAHLPLSGGTITGNLTVSGGNVLIGSGTLSVSGTIGSNANIAALGDIFARGGHYYFGAADQAVLNTTAAGTSLRFSADGWALSWNAVDGTLAFFNNASVPLFTVDAAGNGVFHGTVHGTNVTLLEEQINLLQARIAALEGFSP